MADIIPAALTVAQAAALIASGDVSSEELAEACLQRVAEREPQVEAWAFIDPAQVREQARAADAARKEGKGVGPLHGVPIGIKDVIDTAGMPTEHGCAAFKGRVPMRDAACVTALKSAGAVIMGKTVTTELAAFTPGKTRNPHNTAHTPGGSSSGSAAAVVDGMVPAALGTQTMGSVIRPASFCGVYGYKPTFGMIPRPGVLTQAASLDTVGVMARSVDDLALVADAIQGHDERDPATLTSSRPRLRDIAMQDFPLAPRFVLVKTHAWAKADPVTHDAFRELVEVLGGAVDEVSLDHTTERGLAAARTVQSCELATNFGPLLDRAPDMISKSMAQRIEDGRRIPAVDYVAALGAREALYATVLELINEHGTILTPAAPGPAPSGHGFTGDPVFNGFWTYLGVPAVTVPVLEADGLPMGVQLIGARRDDGRLLRTAKWLAGHLEAGAA